MCTTLHSLPEHASRVRRNTASMAPRALVLLERFSCNTLLLGGVIAGSAAVSAQASIVACLAAAVGFLSHRLSSEEVRLVNIESALRQLSRDVCSIADHLKAIDSTEYRAEQELKVADLRAEREAKAAKEREEMEAKAAQEQQAREAAALALNQAQKAVADRVRAGLVQQFERDREEPGRALWRAEMERAMEGIPLVARRHAGHEYKREPSVLRCPLRKHSGKYVCREELHEYASGDGGQTWTWHEWTCCGGTDASSKFCAPSPSRSRHYTFSYRPPWHSDWMPDVYDGEEPDEWGVVARRGRERDEYLSE